MRFVPESLAVSAILVAYALVGSAVTAQRLAALPPRTRPSLDPLGTALGAAGVLLAAALYALLGRRIARSRGTPADAARAGAAAGLIGGGVGAAAQALALAGYLGSVLSGYGAPDWLAAVALGGYAIVATVFATTYAAVVSWLSFTLSAK